MLPENSVRQRVVSLSLFFLIACVSSAIVTSLGWHIYAQLNNTLLTNGKWHSSKLRLEKSVYGAAQYFMGTPTLAHGELNLGAWYGYQEVVLKDPVRAEYLSFNTLLSSDSYMMVMLDRDKEQFHAIRLSNHPDYESAYIRMNELGEFLSVEPLSHQALGTDQWHWVQVVINREMRTVHLRIDGQDIAELDITLPTEQRLGFRGSYNPTYIDFIEVRDDKNAIVLDEQFSYHDDQALTKQFVLFVVVLGIYGAIFFGVLYWKQTKSIAYGAVLILTMNLVFTFGAFTHYLQNYYLPAYPNPNSQLYRFTKYLELHRRKVEEYSAAHDIAPTVREYQQRGPINVLVIGSSQTWGAGAQYTDETFVHVAEFLANQAAGQERFTFINTGKSGAKSSELLELYKGVWLDFHPQIVVTNLSNNDDDRDAFEKNLRQFAQINAQKGIETVLVLEANSPEFQSDDLPLHSTMSEVAQEYDLQVIDLHSYLRAKEQTGAIWWDNVHLTSYGHRLAGEYLFAEMKSVFDSASHEME